LLECTWPLRQQKGAGRTEPVTARVAESKGAEPLRHYGMSPLLLEADCGAELATRTTNQIANVSGIGPGANQFRHIILA
jgi:hypothetical protein